MDAPSVKDLVAEIEALKKEVAALKLVCENLPVHLQIQNDVIKAQKKAQKKERLEVARKKTKEEQEAEDCPVKIDKIRKKGENARKENPDAGHWWARREKVKFYEHSGHSSLIVWQECGKCGIQKNESRFGFS
jgi:hypothetical protein